MTNEILWHVPSPACFLVGQSWCIAFHHRNRLAQTGHLDSNCHWFCWWSQFLETIAQSLCASGPSWPSCPWSRCTASSCQFASQTQMELHPSHLRCWYMLMTWWISLIWDGYHLAFVLVLLSGMCTTLLPSGVSDIWNGFELRLQLNGGFPWLMHLKHWFWTCIDIEQRARALF